MFFEAGERVGNVWERKEKVLVSMGKDWVFIVKIYNLYNDRFR